MTAGLTSMDDSEGGPYRDHDSSLGHFEYRSLGRGLLAGLRVTSAPTDRKAGVEARSPPGPVFTPPPRRRRSFTKHEDREVKRPRSGSSGSSVSGVAK